VTTGVVARPRTLRAVGMRNSVAVAGVLAVVAAVLLIGAWFLLADRDPARPVAAGTGSPAEGTAPRASGTAAPTTSLNWNGPPRPVGQPSESQARPYPTVPPAQVRPIGRQVGPTVRTGDGGRRVFVEVLDGQCVLEEVRLLAEHADRVEVEVRTIGKPPPPGASVAPDGSYGCAEISAGDGPHAVIDLRAPLGERAVVVHYVL
jgi:hypothetical protein